MKAGNIRTLGCICDPELAVVLGEGHSARSGRTGDGERRARPIGSDPHQAHLTLGIARAGEQPSSG